MVYTCPNCNIHDRTCKVCDGIQKLTKFELQTYLTNIEHEFDIKLVHSNYSLNSENQIAIDIDLSELE